MFQGNSLSALIRVQISMLFSISLNKWEERWNMQRICYWASRFVSILKKITYFSISNYTGFDNCIFGTTSTAVWCFECCSSSIEVSISVRHVQTPVLSSLLVFILMFSTKLPLVPASSSYTVLSWGTANLCALKCTDFSIQLSEIGAED